MGEAPAYANGLVGFRVAYVPEPAASGLLAVDVLALLGYWRRRV